MLLLFAVGGNVVLSTLHISLPAFRVAGGMLLFLQALTLTFSSPGLSSINEVARRDAEKPGDIAVFPLAFPLIASPGALSAVVLLTGRAEGWSEDGSVVRNDGSPWFFAGSVARPSRGTTLTAAACRNARPKSALGFRNELKRSVVQVKKKARELGFPFPLEADLRTKLRQIFQNSIDRPLAGGSVRISDET